MRKRVVLPAVAAVLPEDEPWLDLEQVASAEMSSEDGEFPIENALSHAGTTGWRASTTGPQMLRLHFDEPVDIRRIHLQFVERTAARTQEFAIFACGSDRVLRELVRQQWAFSPGGSDEEIEDYTVSISGVTVLELRIDPDRSHNPAQSQHYATLAKLRIAG